MTCRSNTSARELKLRDWGVESLRLNYLASRVVETQDCASRCRGRHQTKRETALEEVLLDYLKKLYCDHERNRGRAVWYWMSHKKDESPAATVEFMDCGFVVRVEQVR